MELRKDEFYAYSLYPAIPKYANDEEILTWWNEDCDNYVRNKIKEKYLAWSDNIVQNIVGIIPEKVIDEWKIKDPKCKQWAWDNVLLYFIIARAYVCGFFDGLPKPKERVCPICKKIFWEGDVHPTVVRNLGGKQIDICSDCYFSAFTVHKEFIYNKKTDDIAKSKHEIIKYIQKLYDALGIIPSKITGSYFLDFSGYTTAQRVKIIELLRNKRNCLNYFDVIFDSWLEALIAANVVDAKGRATSRGTHCLAKDGHVCLSLGEKVVDDFLYEHGVSHIKEPQYPEGKYRADFKIGDSMVEYFGLDGDETYDKKTKIKKSLCKKHKIRLISIYPKDLMTRGKLEQKFKDFL